MSLKESIIPGALTQLAKPIKVVLAICTIVGGIGGGVAILQWSPWNSDQEATQPIGSEPTRIIPTSAPTSIATPTPAFSEKPPLEQMLEVAKIARTDSGRGDALLRVIEAAVLQGNYEVAVQAGVHIPYASERSNALAFVARCAAEAGEFAIAKEAAEGIPYYSTHDDTISLIVAIKSAHENGDLRQTFADPPVACWLSFPTD